MKLPLLALAISYAVFFGCVLATYGDLPSRVASHFDIAGRPNGWMNRTSYLIFTFAMALGLPLFMVGVTALTGQLGRGLNIPHRDYWLAPERRRSTVATVMRFMVSLCAVVVLLVTAVHGLVVRSNLHPNQPTLDQAAFWIVFIGFLTATAVWCGLLYRKFSRIA